MHSTEEKTRNFAGEREALRYRAKPQQIPHTNPEKLRAGFGMTTKKTHRESTEEALLDVILEGGHPWEAALPKA